MSFSIATLKAFISKKFGVTRNWNTYCQYTDNDSNGYGILLNGVDARLSPSSFTGSVAINFNQDIFNLITDYGATVTYSIYRSGPGDICKYTPNPLTGTVTVGMSDIIVTLNSGCDGVDLSVSLSISGMPALWWDSNCCPLGYCSKNGLTGWSPQACCLNIYP